MVEKDLTKGDITRNILTTSYPLVLALLLQTGFNIVDAIFVGKISAEAIAAVSMAFPVIFLMLSLASGIGVGATSMIARAIGEKNYRKASNIAEHSILIGFVFTIIFSICGIIFGKQIYSLMGASGALLDLILDYSNIIFAGSIFLFLGIAANNIIRGEGDTKTPMRIIMISALINIVLDPILIFVVGWGVKGAAIATVIARFAATVYGLAYLFHGQTSIKLNYRIFNYNFNIVKEIFKMGVPTSAAQVAMSISMFVITRIISVFGAAAIAAYGIGFRLDGIIFMPTLGIMATLIIIVGQCVGAKKFIRAEKTVFRAVYITTAFTLCVGILIFMIPKLTVSLFNTNPDVIMYGVSYIRIMAFTYVFIALGMAFLGAFFGAGKAVPPLVINLLRVLIIPIPVAYILSKYLGVVGVWLALAGATVIAGISALIWFKVFWKRMVAEYEVS